MAQNAFERIVRLVRNEGVRKGKVVAESAAGRHLFDVYAWEDDLFLIQRGLSLGGGRPVRRHPVMLIRKSDLRIGKKGWLFCAAMGNFGTVLTPLFSGVFGKDLCRVPRAKRSETLRRRVVMGNRTEKCLNLLQRDTDFELLRDADEWLQRHGFGLDEVMFFEQTPEIQAYTRVLGQMWRVRPRRYTLDEQREAIGHACQRMDACVRYFVSVRGVHWLTYREFQRVARLARVESDVSRARLLECLREWVSLAPGARGPAAMRRPKSGSRHVIEFFGIPRREAERMLIPALERLLEGMVLGRMTQEDVADTLEGLCRLFLHSLRMPAFADPGTADSVAALYRLLADDLSGDATSRRDFDARRIALPGVTFRGEKVLPHPGVDRHTLQTVGQLVSRLSLNEHAEYINVFEVRSTKAHPSGAGQSREIVLKTDRTPVPISYIEKRLSSVRMGYADYMLTRANVFRALGANYPAFQLLTVVRHDGRREETPYFLRTRCPGDPLDAIPPELFRSDPSNPSGAEDPDIVLALAALYGETAAQNLAVKKYLPAERTCRFGRGKEIFEFVYDPFKRRPMPARVRVCSIRGTMGWPNLERTEDNLRETYRFYMRAYAAVLGDYWRMHADACTLNECASAFFDGFARKTEAMHWAYGQRRADFDAFDPGLRPIYAFRPKLDFALWALERTAEDLPKLRERFMDAVRDVFVKVGV